MPIQLVPQLGSADEQLAARGQIGIDQGLLGDVECLVRGGLLTQDPDECRVVVHVHGPGEHFLIRGRVDGGQPRGHGLHVLHDVIGRVHLPRDGPLDGAAGQYLHVVLLTADPVVAVDHQQTRQGVAAREHRERLGGERLTPGVVGTDPDVAQLVHRQVGQGHAGDRADVHALAKAVAVAGTVYAIAAGRLAIRRRGHTRRPGHGDPAGLLAEGQRSWWLGRVRRGHLGVWKDRGAREEIDEPVQRRASHRVAHLQVAQVGGVLDVVVEGHLQQGRIELVAVIGGADRPVSAVIRVRPCRPLVLEGVVDGQQVVFDLVADDRRKGLLVGGRRRAVDQGEGALGVAGSWAAGCVGVELHIHPPPSLVIGVLVIHLPRPASRGASVLADVVRAQVPDAIGQPFGSYPGFGLGPVARAFFLARIPADRVHPGADDVADAVAEANRVGHRQAAADELVADLDRPGRSGCEVVVAQPHPAAAEPAVVDPHHRRTAAVDDPVGLLDAVSAVGRPGIHRVEAGSRDGRLVAGHGRLRSAGRAGAVVHARGGGAVLVVDRGVSHVAPRPRVADSRIVVVQHDLNWLVAYRAERHDHGPGVVQVVDEAIQLIEVGVILVHVEQDGPLENPGGAAGRPAVPRRNKDYHARQGPGGLAVTVGDDPRGRRPGIRLEPGRGTRQLGPLGCRSDGRHGQVAEGNIGRAIDADPHFDAVVVHPGQGAGHQ